GRGGWGGQWGAMRGGVRCWGEEPTRGGWAPARPGDGKARYGWPGPPPPLAIPATLQDSLMARLDRLASVKRVAQLGATIGRQFAYDLLQTVCPLDAVTLQAGLRQLVDPGLCYHPRVPPPPPYLFYPPPLP